MSIYHVTTVVRIGFNVMDESGKEAEDVVSCCGDILLENAGEALKKAGIEMEPYGSPYEYDTAEEEQ